PIHLGKYCLKCSQNKQLLQFPIYLTNLATMKEIWTASVFLTTLFSFLSAKTLFTRAVHSSYAPRMTSCSEHRNSLIDFWAFGRLQNLGLICKISSAGI